MSKRNPNIITSVSPFITRFTTKIQFPENDEECFEWQAGRYKQGYGQFSVNRRPSYAHRIAYELFKGEIGELQVRHTCDNPPCVNPRHLVLGTRQDNMDDMKARGRSPKGIRNASFGKQGRRGESNANSKLKNADVVNILKLRSLGITLREIADIYGICVQHVWHLTKKFRDCSPLDYLA